LFYYHVQNTRKWGSAKTKPARVKRELLASCPSKFLASYSDYAAYYEKIRYIYEKHNF